MPVIMLDIVTAEKVVYSKEVNSVVAPGTEGELGILPNHSSLMTSLTEGELRINDGSEEILMAISGGFMEVRPDRVIVLADSAERDDEIDLSRAEEARKRAEERLSQPITEVDKLRAEAALHRSITRLKVGGKRRTRRGPATM